LRTTVVAGLAGLTIGHVVWLIAVSVALLTTTVNVWVLIIAAASGALAVVAGLLGWAYYRARATAKAVFLWCLPAAPVLLSVVVLGATYL
jgi:hypothetical protein